MLAWPDLFKLNKLTHGERQKKLNDFYLTDDDYATV